MSISTPIVAAAHTAKPTTIATGLPVATAPMNTRSQKTAESCACASDSAQRRRYDAVLLTAPSTNSIVWIIWCTSTSP